MYLLSNDSGLHPHMIVQHYEAKHRLVDCPECDRKFKTQEGMDQARI